MTVFVVITFLEECAEKIRIDQENANLFLWYFLQIYNLQKKKCQFSPDKMSNSTLRGAPVILSVLNPQTNAYQRIGNLLLLAMKKDNAVFLLFLTPQKKPFLSINTAQPVNWKMTNDVYVTYIDPQGRVFLFQFPSKDETEIFTLIANSPTMRSSGPVALFNNNEKSIPVSPSSQIRIDYKIFDLKNAQIKEPDMTEDDFPVSFGDGTPYQNIYNGGFYGATHIIPLGNNTFAICHIKGEADSPLAAAQKALEQNEIIRQQAEQKAEEKAKEEEEKEEEDKK